MRALGGLLAGVLALGIVACGGAGSPPVQVAPTTAPSAGAPAAPAASAAPPAATAAPDAQDDYDY